MNDLSLHAKICLLCSTTIMLSFFVVKTLLLIGVMDYSVMTNWYEYLSVIFFMPPFFMVVAEFIRKTKIKEAKIDSQLRAIDKSNLVVTLDIKGNVLRANKKFLELVKYDESELLGAHHSTLCSDAFSSSKEYQAFWEKLSRGDFVSGEFERIDKNGDKIWLFGTYTPLPNRQGVYTKVLKIAVDVTEQHKYEELVMQKSVYLEHAAKIIRHDMHSGINTYIPRGLKSLKRRITDADISSLKIKSPLQLIEDGLHHTQKVYAGVYEFTNLVKDGAELNTQSCDVHKILTDYLKLTSYKSEVLLSSNLPQTLDINEALFCTAIDNFIRNGLKYNDSAKKQVSIYPEYHNNNNFVCVEDNGRGLSSEQFEELSKPYTRLEGQPESGTGLGLNIAVEILKTHKFQVWAEKKAEGGTKIYIQL